MLRKTLLALSFAGLTFAGGQALAGPIDSLLVQGFNAFQDKSGERVYRCTENSDGELQSCSQLTLADTVMNAPSTDGDGNVTFDVLAGVLNFDDLNSIDPADMGNELAGVFATRLDGITGGFLNQLAVGAEVFATIFGLDLDTIDDNFAKGNAGDTIALFFSDNNTETLDAIQSDIPGTDGSIDAFEDAVMAIVDGTLKAAVGLVSDDDFFIASGVPAGQTIGFLQGINFSFPVDFGLSFQMFEFSGTFVDGGVLKFRASDGSVVAVDLAGSGNVTTPQSQTASLDFHFGNNIQVEFQRIPEPTTVGLLGLGLLGIGAAVRRRRRTA